MRRVLAVLLLFFNSLEAITQFGETGYLEGQCPQLENDFTHTRAVLTNMHDGVLETLCGGDGQWNCTKVVVYSDGFSSIKQPTSFGLYFLFGLTEGNQYPSFYRPADKQYLFYREELGEWDYWHQYERWIIGPVHDKSVGGIMIKPYNAHKKCPWHIKWFRSNSWFYDMKRENLWNKEGNPWVSDNSIRVDCYNPERWPIFDCGCDVINVTSTGRVLEYHPDRLGQYVRLPFMAKEGYLSPVYGRTTPGAPSYLYSHDIQGRVWLMGSSTSTWSLRLNLLKSTRTPECPFYPRPYESEPSYYDDDEAGNKLPPGQAWEYLQSKRGENEVWLKDFNLEVKCVQEV